jgi:hypothetical protein
MLIMFQQCRNLLSGVLPTVLVLTLVLAGTASGQPASGQSQALPSFELPRMSDPEAVAIVERYLKKIGLRVARDPASGEPQLDAESGQPRYEEIGREVLSGIEDRSTKFNNVKHAPTGETIAEIGLYLKRGYKYREEWEIKEFSIKDMPLAFVQIYNGEQLEGWVQMFGTVSPLEGKTLGVFVWDKHIDDFFAHLEADGYTVHRAGQGLVDDDPADIIEVLDFAGRQPIRYFFSKASGLLLKKEWQDAGGQADVVKKEQFYKLYRPLAFADGSGRAILFSLRQEILLDGDLDTERVYTEVKFNAGLSDQLFEKPEGKPFTGAITSSTPTQPAGAGAPPAAEPVGRGHPTVKKEKEGSATRRPGTVEVVPVTPPSPQEPTKPAEAVKEPQ